MKLFDEDLTDAQRVNCVLQAAIDHFPRFTVFLFSLQQSNADGLLLMGETARHTQHHPVSADSCLVCHADACPVLVTIYLRVS